MIWRRLFVSAALMANSYGFVWGQEGEFCNAIAAITRDAPNKFRNVRGKVIEARMDATYWVCGITIPGTIQSRFVASMGLFYEGAFFQTKKKEEIRDAYERYKNMLAGCLAPLGYRLSEQENFSAGLSDYKKLVFMPELKEDEQPEKPPPHITMEAAFSKELGIYTVVMYIFEH